MIFKEKRPLDFAGQGSWECKDYTIVRHSWFREVTGKIVHAGNYVAYHRDTPIHSEYMLVLRLQQAKDIADRHYNLKR